MKPRIRPCRNGWWLCIGGGAVAFAISAEAAYAAWKYQRDRLAPLWYRLSPHGAA